MKITEEILKNNQMLCESISNMDKSILSALLIDLQEVNEINRKRGKMNMDLYIDFQDWHDEYSPERTDPCPDYYGMYRIKLESDPDYTLGDAMTLAELDNLIFFLNEYENII